MQYWKEGRPAACQNPHLKSVKTESQIPYANSDSTLETHKLADTAKWKYKVNLVYFYCSPPLWVIRATSQSNISG